ncbi:MAG: NADH-quinone oxidoreductase subunit L [Candidatus Hydrogenedentes bacterium]|nr:NADH-quinone oxidoreductase subunit L [Candidatus Hydrogenedentota bacterium]
MNHAWLIPALPLISFAIVGMFIRPRSDKAAGIVATAAVFTSLALALKLATEFLQIPSEGAGPVSLVPWSTEWLRYDENLVVSVGVLVDPISVLLMVVVTCVSALVHLYSIGYMHGDPGYGRFFTYLNLFTFSMLGLVVAPNIVQMYVCWELVGVSSFLLIGFYYEKPSAVAASKKAFIVTRFADLGFLIGVLLLGYWGHALLADTKAELNTAASAAWQPFDFAYLTSEAFLNRFLEVGPHILGLSLLAVAMICVYMGAAGKSAMFPLHIWLPDAMEGPTPVSALIHAATMVVAGVYLVARMFPAFSMSVDALTVVAYVGGFTSLFAAVIAVTQDDIKRVLAFSTLSQLGYMMMALGVASMGHSLGYTASMFHLFTHAFFKALLFLGAGAIIHAVHSNDIWDMGGLRKHMPITHLLFAIAWLAICGIWPLAGFFSKDEILAAALHGHYTVLFGIALFVAGLTSFYMSRIYFATFWGTPRSKHAEHAHEAPKVMLLPMGVLAVLSCIAGFAPMAEWVHIGEPLEHHGIDFTIAIPATIAGVLGIAVAAVLYARGDAALADRLANSFRLVYRVVKNKFYFDELYLFVTKRVIFMFVARPIAWFDRHVVDGGVNLSGWSTRKSGAVLSRLQTGQIQTYSMWLAAGGLFVLLVLWAMGV